MQFIRECIAQDYFYLTWHAHERMLERQISIAAMKRALVLGEIIEREPNDYPYPFCLVLGWLESGDPLHVKCSFWKGTPPLRIVTVYEPDDQYWESDYKTRKR